MAARLPLRRAAPRRRARDRRRLGDRTSSSSSPPRSTRWPRQLRPAAVPHRRERPQRPPARPQPRRRRLRARRASWADEWHHALHAVLTGERDGYYADFGSLPHAGARRSARRGCTTAPTRRTASGCTAGRRPGWPATSSWSSPRTTTRSATGPPGSGSRALISDGPAQGRRRPAAHLAVRADAVPGRGVGRRARRSSTSPTTTIPGSAGPSARAAAREFAAFGWDPGRRARSAGPGDVRALQAGLGRGQQRPPRRPAGLVPRADRPAPADPGADRSAARPGRDRVRRRDGWLVVRRGPVTVAATSARSLDLPGRPRRNCWPHPPPASGGSRQVRHPAGYRRHPGRRPRHDRCLPDTGRALPERRPTTKGLSRR